MATSNEIYRDASLRHAVGVRRYTAGVAKRVAALLEEADADLIERLRLRLGKMQGRPIDFTGERWTNLLAEIRDARHATMLQYQAMTRPELQQFGVMEARREVQLLGTSVPIEYQFAGVSPAQLRSIATSRPFQGRFLRDWYATVEAADRSQLTRALQLGMVQGESVDDTVRRVAGTRAKGFTDGVLSMTRRNAQAVVRTAVNHVSNTAREEVWAANADVITAKIWVATLDGRTSDICRANDGKGMLVSGDSLPEGVLPLKPKGLKPPAHINCRSLLVAYIDGVGLLGSRPTVTDTRTPQKREVDFRRMARQQGRPIQEIRREWAAENVGRVPAATNYQTFLSRQNAKFQDDVLGKTKGQLFRKGGLDVDQFVDRSGTELTLRQLAQTRPEAFRAAGLKVSKFE